MPHLEAIQVRVYDTNDVQLLPVFEEVSYWKEILAASPTLFQGCTTHQDRFQVVQELLNEERFYLDYGLDWPDLNEKVTSPLRFTCEELRQMVSAESSHSERTRIMNEKGMMQFAGVINREETMKGHLPDGRTIFVEMLSVYSQAPENQRDDPQYWLARVNKGDFDDEENYPMVWIQ